MFANHLRRRAVNVIIYWLKVVQLDTTMYVKKMYFLMYKNVDNNSTHMS